ncbi:MAG TPA: hypothetical protein VGM94_17430 [Galbitalea sp.]|jgi:hypothetical protein
MFWQGIGTWLSWPGWAGVQGIAAVLAFVAVGIAVVDFVTQRRDPEPAMLVRVQHFNGRPVPPFNFAREFDLEVHARRGFVLYDVRVQTWGVQIRAGLPTADVMDMNSPGLTHRFTALPGEIETMRVGVIFHVVGRYRTSTGAVRVPVVPGELQEVWRTYSWLHWPHRKHGRWVKTDHNPKRLRAASEPVD